MRTVILGVGNILLTDEGIGVRVIETLQQRYRFPPDVEVVDGGTAGMELLETLEHADNLIIVDAVRVGQPPGTVVRMAGDEVPVFFRTKISPHQIGISDLMAALYFRDASPKNMVVIGFQAVDLSDGMKLSPQAAAKVDYMATRVVGELANLGITVEALA
ncbi:MAG: HyaD/HybD family hydrogenase maturation endopeptidase [Rhodocyclaceae bacterium]|nr:HyaD/HybD family hydrogenase maturation endopeptidase [Rhodocyclaceae bacterium]